MASTTWNPSDLSGITLSSNNLVATSNGAADGAVRAIAGSTGGKYYFEFVTNTFSIGNAGVGIANASAALSSVGNSVANACLLYRSGNIWLNGSNTGSSLGTTAAGTIVGVALDLSNFRIWFRSSLNANWNGSGTANPATNTGGISISAIASASVAVFPAFSLGSANDRVTANFGAGYFSLAVPSGFTAGYPNAASQPIPTNTTWNPSDKSSTLTLSGNNGIAHYSQTTGNPGGVRSTDAKSAGKYYFELTGSGWFSNNSGLGVATSSAVLSSAGATPANVAVVYRSGAIYVNNAQPTGSPSLGTRSSGDTIGIAIDLGTRRIWFRVAPSGNWNGSGTADPATNTGGADISFSGSLPLYALSASDDAGTAGDLITANFGDVPFVGSVPAGYTSGLPATSNALSVTLDAATLSATGVLSTPTGPNTGRLEPFTFAPATLAATAVNRTGGQLSRTLDALVLNPPGTGAEKFGALAASLAPLTLAGAGTKVSGRLDAILASLTLAGAGAVAKTGRLDRTLQTIALAGSGALANRGILDQTLGALTLAATNSARTFFMAWTTEGAGFDSSMLREDESVFSFELVHEEADFPSLRLDCKNPKVGLLAAGRNQWVWFSWRDPASGEIVPLFHGRLIGIPEDLADEVVRLQFVARPSNYIEWKNIVAAGLKVRPFWDPVWIAEGDTDPDTVLEARPAAWHIDRVSLAVTASDTIVGEDGTLAITADDHFYDALKVSYGDTPLRRVDVTGTVTWTQHGSDVVDITRQVYDQFRFAGSPYEFPMVSSFTGDGLLNDWPNPGDSIGGGWSMDATALALQATWQNAWLLSIAYVSPVLSTAQEIITPGHYQWGGGWAGAGIMGWKPAVTRDREYVSAHETIGTVFPLLPISTTFTVRWEASRGRTEIVKFAMTADTQPLLVDPGDDEMDKIDLSSDFVGQPIDPGGALPLGDLKRNSYFNTDRGNASVEYLIMLARAKMLSRARAVSLSVETPFGFATRLSCRQNATVFDPRLPGGQGTGKVTRYALSVDGDSGEAKAEITLGCTIGRGNSVTPDPGEETYGEPDWSNDYQAMDAATLDAGTGDILYESFDGMDVVDDDGLDLFRMTPDRVIRQLDVWDGPDIQQNTLNSFYRNYEPPGVEVKPPEMGAPVGTYTAPETPTEMLSKIPTVVDLQLVPISRQSFETTWEPSVSALMVPKTIDLEADYSD